MYGSIEGRGAGRFAYLTFQFTQLTLMPIAVTCPSCHKRFRVSDKFAGQKGPCPKCKKEITVPSKEDEVVVHAPEVSGPSDSKGRAVLEPLQRTDSSFSVVTAVAYGVMAIIAVVVALVIRGQDEGVAKQAILIASLLFVAIPVVRAGYGFIADDEFELFYGRELWVRTLICSCVYALLWIVFDHLIKGYVFQGAELELFHYVIVVPAMVAAGAFAGLACFDLEFTNGLVHYGMYLLVTVLLRLLMGMSL